MQRYVTSMATHYAETAMNRRRNVLKKNVAH